MNKKYIEYHNDGTIWGRAKMIDNIPTGYSEWFGKNGTMVRSGFFDDGEQTGSGSLMIRKEKPIR